MNKDRIIYQVDAFTSEPFKGNPAGVYISDDQMPQEWMQKIASELNVSETAFIFRENNKFNIRFFTPESEIPLCGHATLSSAHILFETGIAGKDDVITFRSKAGELKASYSSGSIVLDFPAYSVNQVPVPEDIYKYTGIKPSGFYRTSHGWSLAILDNEDQLTGMNPDFRAMKNSEYGDLIVTSPSFDPDYDFAVRCFVPALGIDEDPVTGSAHCALATYWHSITGRNKFVSHQVSRRSGVLRVTIKDDRVLISGFAITIFKAELFV